MIQRNPVSLFYTILLFFLSVCLLTSISLSARNIVKYFILTVFFGIYTSFLIFFITDLPPIDTLSLFSVLCGFIALKRKPTIKQNQSALFEMLRILFMCQSDFLHRYNQNDMRSNDCTCMIH